MGGSTVVAVNLEMAHTQCDFRSHIAGTTGQTFGHGCTLFSILYRHHGRVHQE